MRRRDVGQALTLCAALLSAALVTGCTSGSEGADGVEASTGPERQKKSESPSTPPSTAHDERRLGEQAERAVGAEAIDDSDPLFVESGLERVGDGIHTESELPQGRSFELSVACAGKGEITLSVGPKKPVSQTVDCDGVPVLHRVTDPPGRLRIDTESRSGAAGMVAWRLAEAE
ncbi:hypothetical protein [Streptomyces sp. NPDC047525]|uniref:hypothetical protein n=1 Tax=Streptomyces sp. NPDC047525 TaxID=3155264 RepID=UPI00340FF0E8